MFVRSALLIAFSLYLFCWLVLYILVTTDAITYGNEQRLLGIDQTIFALIVISIEFQ